MSRRKRERERGGGREYHRETCGTEITDLPDDNPPWWHPRVHMDDPHDC